MFTKENQQIQKKKKIEDQIRSRFDPLDRDQCRDARWTFAMRSVRRWDRCEQRDRWDSATRWLGLARVGWARAGRERKRAERERKGAEIRPGCWGWLGGSGQWRKRESKESKSEMSREGDARVFWKMVYGKKFRKPFSLFSSAIFRSICIRFLLTSVLQHPKRLKMLKTFYGKHFTSKQTEPKTITCQNKMKGCWKQSSSAQLEHEKHSKRL